jgi:hypothetical protein
LYLNREEYEILPNPPHKATSSGVIPMYCDGFRLLTFYRGFNKDALVQIKSTAKWRAANQTNRIRSLPLSDLLGCSVKQFEQYYQAGCLGISQDGLPVIVRRLGMLDLKALKSTFNGGDNRNAKKTTADIFIDSHIWEMEVRPDEECHQSTQLQMFTYSLS